MKIVVSACLLGENCKYNGGNNRAEAVIRALEGHEVIPVCPERCLGVPRIPMELQNGRLVNREGESVDGSMRASVAEIMQQLEGQGAQYAVLKSRSPTCGVRQIYDGTFSGRLVAGMGLLAQTLKEAGYELVDCEDITDGYEFGK